MRWVPPRGAPGAATGATATGAAGISTSTTIIILIATITSTASKEASFSTMRSIAETLLMGIGKQRTSLAARLAGRAAHAKGPVLLIAPEAELELAPVVALELELELAPVEELELELAPVEELELELARVVELELVLARVVAELEPAPVEAVLAPSHRRAQRAISEARFAGQIIPVNVRQGKDMVVFAYGTDNKAYWGWARVEKLAKGR